MAIDRVFEQDGFWWCRVGGRVYGAWICKPYAKAGMQVEQARLVRKQEKEKVETAR